MSSEKRQKFSIRKFSIGIASVMIGQFYLGTVTNAPKVQADERTKTEVETVSKQEDQQLPNVTLPSETPVTTATPDAEQTRSSATEDDKSRTANGVENRKPREVPAEQSTEKTIKKEEVADTKNQTEKKSEHMTSSEVVRKQSTEESNNTANPRAERSSAPEGKSTAQTLSDLAKVAESKLPATASDVSSLSEQSTSQNRRKKRDIEPQTKEEVDAANEKLRADYEKALAEYYKKFSETMTENMAKQAAYNKAYAEYQAQKAKYEANLRSNLDLADRFKNVEGNLSQVHEQNLQFKSEPNATLHSEGGSNIQHNVNFGYLGNKYNEKSTVHQLKLNESVTATYTNLQNTAYKGRRITKVVYTATYVYSSKPESKVNIGFTNDPTRGIQFANENYPHTNVDTQIKLTAKFYYEDGSLVEFDKNAPALFSLSSLNNHKGQGTESIEYARDFSGKLVPITGSTVAQQPNGNIYAQNNNVSKAHGSKYDVDVYDKPGSGLEHYAAIAGIANTGTEVSVTFGSTDGSTWSSFNSNVKSAHLVENNAIEPTKPKFTDYPTVPKAPNYKTYTEKRKQNEIYTPHSDVIVTEKGTTPNAQDGIGNKEALPSGTTYSFVGTAPDTSTPGIQNAIIRVTYPDHSTTDVTVKVVVLKEKSGAAGKDGASIHSGSGTPKTNVGNNGDTYVNTTNGDIYKKEAGVWQLAGNIKGAQGSKGDKGDTGAQGSKGDKGDTGAQGPKGSKGDTGAQGSKGAQGDTGAQGPKGDTGATGRSIHTGSTRPDSAQGQNGDVFVNVLTGDLYKKDNGTWKLIGNVKGSRGDKGDTGTQGPKGDKGDTGAQGPKGDKGDTGAQGPKGDTGATGRSIHTGSTRPDNVQGQNGDVFVNVLTGDLYKKDNGTWKLIGNVKGSKGDTGAQGPKGNKGDTGAQGSKGDTGDTGAQGPKGDTGVAGRSIHTGSTRPDSAQGQNGDIFVNVLTGDLYKKDNGTWKLIGNVKGSKGDTGAQGPKGDTGATGRSIHTGSTRPDNAQGQNGDVFVNVLTGDLYRKDNGTWKLIGNVKGSKGDTGAQGPKGDKGDTGAQGPKGSKGDTGAQGPKGNKGDTGAQGPKGDKGDTGAQGPKGDKGDTGAQGPKGDKGDTGINGTTPGGTTPGGNKPNGTTPGGTTPGGNKPNGTTPGGNKPNGTTPGGSTPGGNKPNGTTPGGTTPGGNKPNGTTPGGNKPNGTTPGGTTPGGNKPNGTTPGGTTSGGNKPNGTTPGDNKPNGSNLGNNKKGPSPDGLRPLANNKKTDTLSNNLSTTKKATKNTNTAGKNLPHTGEDSLSFLPVVAWTVLGTGVLVYAVSRRKED